MKHPVVLASVGLLAILGAVGLANRGYINALLENDIGAPTDTHTSARIEPVELPALRLAAAGDVGTGGTEAYRTAEVMDELDRQSEFDALLLLGDNVYEDGDPSQVEAKVLEPFASVLDGNTELIPVLGNHDVESGHGEAQASALGMPGPWYVTQTDTTTIIALDSNQPDNAEQQAWLRSTLANATAPWTIVLMHHPAYSAGWHGGDPDVVSYFVPLFEQYGVDLVLSGHDHDYQRSRPINGITYVVTGAGAKLRATGREDFTAVSWSTYHFVDLAVYPDRMLVQAVDHNSRVIDSFTLHPD